MAEVYKIGDAYSNQEDSTSKAEGELKQQQVLDMLGATLLTKAQDQVSQRTNIEQRWLEDLLQYNGEYDPSTKEKLKTRKQSAVFVNITRAKCNAAEARLSDMLFPTDDKSWGIQPTPNPELSDSAAVDEPAVGPDGQPMMTPEGNPITVGDVAGGIMRAASKRAEAMEREIDDQLTEAGYNETAREVIHDAVVYGTGIIKGPIVVGKTRRAWRDIGQGVQALEVADELRPGVERVEIWDFFPDMSARSLEEAEFIFERKYVTRAQLITMARERRLIPEQVMRVLENAPRTWMVHDNHLAQMREMAGVQNVMNDSRYEIWEYTGPLDREELIACGCDIPSEEDEPFAHYEATALFIGPYVMKAYLTPLESNERVYSMFVWEKDDTTLFGRGVPRTMRQPQRVINSAWRMTMDNAGLSVGPQVVIDREIIRPADGNWELTPRKLWYKKDPEKRMQDAFFAFEISSHQAELAAIFQTAKELVDEETSLPLIAQGDMGPNSETATARSIAMNASNVVLRRVVKAWDDKITKTLLRRFYDWNMQNSDKAEIKGDFEVDARGSSVLLVKELQTQALLGIMQYGLSPIYGPLTKHAELYRKLVQSQQIPPDEVIYSDDEIQQQQSTQPEDPPDPAILKLQQELQIHQDKMQDAQAERENNIQIKQAELQIAMMRLSGEQELTVAQIDAQLKKVFADNQTKRDLAAAEIALKRQAGSGI